LIESASLWVSKWVKALSGTGFDTTVLVLPEDPPPPLLDDVGREVPLKEVFALDEMAPLVLAFDSTVEVEFAVEDGESAELELTLFVLGVVTLNADVEAAGCDAALVMEDGVSCAFPADAPPPAPAPDDEPAELEAMAAAGELIDVAWM
jgi:hypothetical protein